MEAINNVTSKIVTDSKLSAREQALIDEYKKALKIVENQRDKVELALGQEEKIVLKDAQKYAALQDDERVKILAEKKKEDAIKAAVDKKLQELKNADQLAEKKHEKEQKAAFQKQLEDAVARAVEKAKTEARKTNEKNQIAIQGNVDKQLDIILAREKQEKIDEAKAIADEKIKLLGCDFDEIKNGIANAFFL